MTSEQHFQAAVSLQLKEWKVRISDLKAKAENLTESAQNPYLGALDKLNQQQQLLAGQVAEIKTAGQDRWQVLKKEIKATLKAMDQGFYSALELFR